MIIFIIRIQFYWFDQSRTAGIACLLLNYQSLTSPRELSYWLNPSFCDWDDTSPIQFHGFGFSLIFQGRPNEWPCSDCCAPTTVGIMDDDIVRPPGLDRVLCWVLRMALPCMDDNSQNIAIVLLKGRVDRLTL